MTADTPGTDDTPALAQLRREAQGGSPDAMFQLASALVTAGRVEEAAEPYRQAAQSGHANAQIGWARMRLYGIDAAPDTGEAVEWLTRAETAGHPVASYLLALVALGGTALPRDGRINERMMTAVRADYPPALRAAAIHFGGKPGPGDQTLCLQLLQGAVDRGDAVAAQLLAERLAHGEGCDPQPQTAEALWQQLAQHGIPRLPAIDMPLPTRTASGAAATLAFEEALVPPPWQELAGQPRVRQVDGLLSADECRLLMATAQPLLRASMTVDPVTGAAIDDPVRTSSDASFDPLREDFALRLVQLRMARAAQAELVQAEQLIVLRYAPGQQYRPHRDYLPPGKLDRDRPGAGNRGRTICVYLNEVASGGETEFPAAGLRITPRPGRAVIFDNLHNDGQPDIDALHAGCPVIEGEKWLATLWLRQQTYRWF